jgi:two-component system sensor histidine kinase PilS (NtrC family)
MNFFKFNFARYFRLSLPQAMSTSGDLSLQTRAINIINIFRFLLSLTFFSFFLYLGEINWVNSENANLFFKLSAAYLLLSIGLLVLSRLSPTSLMRSLPVQIVLDIIFITLLMHTTGGIQNGLGLLLIITIVTASLVSQGRMALFYAAVASIGLLLEQSYQIIKWDSSPLTYTQPVMLSLSCFATAWLAYSLAKRMHHSEALASARGIDLENLAQVNALITQEMHDGVIVVDQDFNIRHHNLQAELLLSLPKDNVSYLRLADSIPEIALVLQNWLKGEDSSAIITVGNRELKLRVMPIHPLSDWRELPPVLNSPLNPYFGAVIFIQDWSQLQAAAQQAKLAALGRLTANIAHEIRNPLSAISHANQLLQEEDHLSASTARILQIVADNIQRIDQIVKDVLELNRRDRTHQEPIELGPFLSDFHTQFCAVEKIPTLHFQLDVPLQKQIINFDQRHLTQVLWNLCKNAWQHSLKKNASVYLRCVEVGRNGINIEVIDDGAGIADQDKLKLFEPFFTTTNTGSGLGLYISRELAEANGASLQYQALSTGSAFILHLNKSAQKRHNSV